MPRKKKEKKRILNHKHTHAHLCTYKHQNASKVPFPLTIPQGKSLVWALSNPGLLLPASPLVMVSAGITDTRGEISLDFAVTPVT